MALELYQLSLHAGDEIHHKAPNSQGKPRQITSLHTSLWSRPLNMKLLPTHANITPRRFGDVNITSAVHRPRVALVEGTVASLPSVSTHNLRLFHEAVDIMSSEQTLILTM